MKYQKDTLIFSRLIIFFYKWVSAKKIGNKKNWIIFDGKEAKKK